MSEREWLEQLKAGDEVVVVSGGGFHNLRRIVPVDRTTPTQIVVGASRYLRRNGREIGGGAWSAAHIEEPTTDVRLDIEMEGRRRAALAVVTNALFRNLPTGTLERIADIIRAAESPEPQSER